MGGVHRKRIIIISVLAFLLLLLVAILLLTSQKLKQTFAIQDICGKFMTLTSHTLQTEEACIIQCRNECRRKELSYVSVAFEDKDPACNDCACTCR